VEDAPTGPLGRQEGPAWTEPADTDAGEADPAPPGERRAGDRRTGGRRYRAGRPPPERPRASEPPQAQPTTIPSGLRARVTLAGLFAWCLASCLLAAWMHVIVVAGLGFCAGCALAAWVCQPAALLRMVIAVPSVFLLAEVVAQVATLPSGGRRGLAVPVAGGTLLVLAAVAPWLFGGTAAAVAIALFRGLPGCVRDLRAGLQGWGPPRRAPRGPLGPRAQQALRLQQALRAPQAPRAEKTPRG